MNSSPFSAADDALLQLARALQQNGYHHITVTPATHERVNARPGNEWAENLEGIFGWSRPFHADIVPAPLFELMKTAGILSPHADGWRSHVRLSTLSGQVFWHSTYPTLEADAVFFGPDTYRYASALDNYFASNARAVARIVDIGCGAGPGAIVSALSQPQAFVIGVDINPNALRLTRINAALAGVENLEARHSNLLSDVEGSFDLIIANPPYLLDPSERAYRHGGGPLGAGLSLAIVDVALERLTVDGTLLLYTGVAIVNGDDPFKDAVAVRLDAPGVAWSYREVDPDVFGEELECEAYAHADRIAAVVLTATTKEPRSRI